MRSPQHPTTSKSTASEKSTTTETSTQNENSSATAATSFVLDGKSPNPKLKWLHDQRLHHDAKLKEVEATEVPTVALYRKARTQSVNRYRNIIRDIDEAIAYELNKADTA